MAKEFVLYCHVGGNPKDPGRPIDKEKNVGFATVVVMDGGGDIIARAKDRPQTLDDFKQLAAQAAAYVALRKRADDGDGSAKIDLVIRHFELLRMTGDDARRLLKELPKPSAPQQAALDRFFANEEVLAIMKSIKKTAASRIAAGKSLAEMRRAGRLPEDRFRSWGYWSAQADYAETLPDAALFEECLKELKARFPQESLKKQLAEFEVRLETLRK